MNVADQLPDASRQSFSSRRVVLMCGVAAWLIAGAAALIASGAVSMSAAPSALVIARSCAFASALVIFPALIISRLALRHIWSNSLCMIIASVAALCCVGVAINIPGWCPDADFITPRLMQEDTDTSRELLVIKSIAQGLPLPFTAHTGYPLLSIWLTQIFGGGILCQAMFSAFCMTLTTGVTAAISVKLLADLPARRTACTAALLFALVPSVAWYGSLAMKEAPVILSFSLVTLMIAAIWRNRLGIAQMSAGVAGAFLLMLLKSPLGWLLLGALVLIILSRLWSNKRLPQASSLSGLLFASLLCVMIIAGGRQFRSHSEMDLVAPTDKKEMVENNMFGAQSVKSYSAILGDYYTASVPVRLTKLPLAAAAQYFPPFPWNFTRDRHIGRFVPYAHLPLWYVVGGIILGYYILCLWRRNRAGGLVGWSLWVFICWLAIAYSSGGSVARYWLPLLPAMIPLGVKYLTNIHFGLISHKSVIVYSATYLVILSGALCGAYMLLY